MGGVFFRYTVMRIMLFIGFLAIFNLLRVNFWISMILSVILSAVASYFLQRPDRERLAHGIEQRVEGRIARRRAAADAQRVDEDEFDER